MGFLDDLFGGKKTAEQVSLAGLDGWLQGRIDAETSDIISDCEGALESINDLIPQIRADVKALGERELKKIDSRYDKIVRSAKPGYVKSMLNALERLEYSGRTYDDIAAYRRRLPDALDTVGKVNFGDGKFLTFAYRDDMTLIQTGCKRLLDEKEELDSIIQSARELPALTWLKEKHKKHQETTAQLRNLEGETKTLTKMISDDEGGMKSAEHEIGRLEVSHEAERARKIKSEIEEIAGEVKSTETPIHYHLSPLTQALRKYEKTQLDSKQMNLVKALIEDATRAFLAADQVEIEKVLAGLSDSIKSGGITVKDPDKTLKKIEHARETLNDEMRTKHHNLKGKLTKLHRELESIKVGEEIERLNKDITALKASIVNHTHKRKDLQDKTKVMKTESEKILDEIKTGLKEMNVELT